MKLTKDKRLWIVWFLLIFTFPFQPCLLADEAQSQNFRLKASTLSSNGSAGSSQNYALKWATLGETPGGFPQSANYKAKAGFPAQLASIQSSGKLPDKKESANNIISPTHVFQHDPYPPTIFNLIPADGTYINAVKPEISAEYKDVPEGGIDVASVKLKVDGVDVTAQAIVTEAKVTYLPTDPLPDGPHSFIVNVSDKIGNPAAPASATFTVDTILPIVYMTSPVDQQSLSETSVNVLGYVSDVNLAGVKVNDIAATIEDAGFSVSLSLTEGANPIQATAVDLAGNTRSQTIAVTLDTVPPVVAITSPADLATVDASFVTVEGTVDDPKAMVFVNLIPAVFPSLGVWRALNVPLAIGTNEITAIAVDPAGNQAMTGIQIQTFVQTATLTLDVNPKSGTSPLNVTLTPITSLPNVLDFQYDWEGDGIIDSTASSASPANHSYSKVDTYQPTVTVKTASGGLFTAQANINVHEPETADGQVTVAEPVDVEVDEAGLIYVLSRSESRIYIFSFDEAQKVFNLQKTITGSWSSPQGFDLVTSDLSIYVADTGNHRVEKLVKDAAGDYVADVTFGSAGSIGTFGTEPGQFDNPFDVTIDEDESIFVSDQNNHRIQKFDRSGNFLTSFGTSGSNPGEFNKPQGIAYSPLTMQVFVADSGNHRLQAFDRSGEFEKSIGALGSDQGKFNSPSNLTPDEIFDELAVADRGNNRIELLSETGEFLQELSGLGLSNPQGVAAPPIPKDQTIPARALYIADTGNNRVLVVKIPQGSSEDSPLTPYYNLIAALQANDVGTTVSQYISEKQKNRKVFFNMIQTNEPNGLISLGQEMTQDEPPILIQHIGDEALYIIEREEEGEMFEYDLFLERENGQWKIVQL